MQNVLTTLTDVAKPPCESLVFSSSMHSFQVSRSRQQAVCHRRLIRVREKEEREGGEGREEREGREGKGGEEKGGTRGRNGREGRRGEGRREVMGRLTRGG